jgi:hypothetical protein
MHVFLLIAIGRNVCLSNGDPDESKKLRKGTKPLGVTRKWGEVMQHFRLLF